MQDTAQYQASDILVFKTLINVTVDMMAMTSMDLLNLAILLAMEIRIKSVAGFGVTVSITYTQLVNPSN